MPEAFEPSGARGMMPFRAVRAFDTWLRAFEITVMHVTSRVLLVDPGGTREPCPVDEYQG